MVQGLIVKGGTLNLSRKNCFVVAMRNLRSDHPGYGRWELIKRCGFTVVCASKLEAEELILMVGSVTYPPPRGMVDDDRYLAWLKRGRFYTYPYEATGRGEVMFGEWVRGWVPDGHEMTSGVAGSMTRTLVENMLRAQMVGK